jgi:hypothetical protein
MAHLYQNVKGRPLAKFIAQLPEVQAEVERRTFEIAVRAEALLLEHFYSGDAYIEIEHGDIDWYVVLNDEAGQKHALSIEYGRAAGEFERKNPKTGRMETVSYGAMDGLYILARASNLPKQRKGKVRL